MYVNGPISSRGDWLVVGGEISKLIIVVDEGTGQGQNGKFRLLLIK